MGPLVSLAQRADVLARLGELRREAELVAGGWRTSKIKGADRERGAFVPPLLLLCRDPRPRVRVHRSGGIRTGCNSGSLPGYGGGDRAGAPSGGSLVASVFSADDVIRGRFRAWARALPWTVLVVNGRCAKESTGHGSPLASLVHGGPGRAGGGEEMGGIRGVLHYMQRTAVQGSPDTTDGARGAVGARQPASQSRHASVSHSVQRIAIGRYLQVGEREVTVEDIERFAALTGDNFYAHMSETRG